MMTEKIKLKIGEVAKLTRVHPLTIKRLEERGAIKSERSLCGHRLFDLEVVDQVKRIYGSRSESV